MTGTAHPAPVATVTVTAPAATAAAVAATTVATHVAATPATLEIDGSLVLSVSDPTDIYSTATGECAGLAGSGFDDITRGAAVTVTNAAGTVVAVGELETGVLGTDTSSGDSNCTLGFKIPDVPLGSAFYSVEVSHRGSIAYPVKTLMEDDIVVSLGD